MSAEMAEQSISPVSKKEKEIADEFDPTAEMLNADYDDEQTLDEEEAMSGGSCSNELSDLEKEGDMPLEDLLSMYGYGANGNTGTVSPSIDTNCPRGESSSNFSGSDDSSHEAVTDMDRPVLVNDLTLDKDEIARDLLRDSDDADQETSANELLDSVDDEMASQTVRLLRSSNNQDSDSDSAEDEDYAPVAPMEDWKKTINVGSDYQAIVPQGLCKYQDTPALEAQARLLWDPNKLGELEVEKYLDNIHQENQEASQGLKAIPEGSHRRDREEALYTLLQSNFNTKEALKKHKTEPTADPLLSWSEEECRNFENGLRLYGKNFFLIQQNKVPTRTVGDLVQFYYLWKKTERHDEFAYKTKLEKKKYVLHPGVTDYMDRFMDEQDNPARDGSDSPINSLTRPILLRERRDVSDTASTTNHNIMELHPNESLTASTPSNVQGATTPRNTSISTELSSVVVTDNDCNVYRTGSPSGVQSRQNTEDEPSAKRLRVGDTNENGPSVLDTSGDHNRTSIKVTPNESKDNSSANSSNSTAENGLLNK